MLKLTVQVTVIATALGLSACGGHDYKVSEKDMDASLAAFNDSCLAVRSGPYIDWVESKYDTLPDEGEVAFGLDRFAVANYEPVPLENYDQLKESGTDAILCFDIDNKKAATFAFPDLSNLYPMIVFEVIESDTLRFLPEGLAPSSIIIDSSDVEDISALGNLVFSADKKPTFWDSHVYINRLNNNAADTLPAQWQIETSGKHPFTFSTSGRFDSPGGLIHLDKAHLAFYDTDSIFSDRFPENSAFCEAYEKGTMAFIFGNAGHAIPKSEWQEIPKPYICDDGQKAPDPRDLED